jgi:MerR family transcriptional regulator, light-induced transcriptional regulator
MTGRDPASARRSERLEGIAPVTALCDALVVGDRRSAWHDLEAALDRGATYLDVSVGAIQPALYEVGRRWSERRISVAQEHLATATASTLLSSAYARSARTAHHGRRSVFAAAAGNTHVVGLRMLSDAFELAGWDVKHLGADVPTDDLVHHVAAFPTDLLALTASLPHHVDPVRDAIARLRHDLGGDAPTVMVGGQAFADDADLWRRVGADLTSPDAECAVDAVA